MTYVCTPWLTEADLADCDCGAGEIHQTLLADMLLAASDTLYLITGRRFSGQCVDKIARPCRVRSGLGWDRPWWSPTLPWLSSTLFGCSCSSTDECGCAGVDSILLGREYVTAVTEVKVDGAIVASSAYRLVNDRLYRSDGNSWPCCQDLSKPDSAVGTWSVKYTAGLDPPPALKLAARTLAIELVRACAGRACRITPVELDGIVAGGRTGLADVDLAIISINPSRHRWPPRAYAV